MYYKSSSFINRNQNPMTSFISKCLGIFLYKDQTYEENIINLSFLSGSARA